MFKCLKKNKGFTLLELLVAAGIIALLSAIVLPNYRNMDKQYALNLAANKLVQDIRSAQEMALAAAECAPCGGIVPSRYGVFVKPGDGFYQIMAETSANANPGIFDNPPEAGDYSIGTINFGKTIFFDSNSGVGGTACSPPLGGGPKWAHITFAPPDPATELKIGRLGNPNPIVSCSEIILTIRNDSGLTKSVKINKAGLIYVQ